MPTRRNIWSRMEPSMPMTPRGHTGTLMLMDGMQDAGTSYQQSQANADDPASLMPQESPQAFRRRVLPLVDAPQSEPTLVQQLASFLHGQ